MIHKRDPHTESATERARVAAELMAEAEHLTKTVGMATPDEVNRAQLPPPLAPTIDSEPQRLSVPVSEEPPVAPRTRPVAPVQHDGPIRYETARADLERLLQDEPTNVAVHLQLAALLAKRGLRAEGVPHLRRAVELEPERVTAWYQLGELLNRLDDLAGAKAAFERAIALDARHARSLYGLGIVLDRMNRPDEATLLYRRSREAASWRAGASNGDPPGAPATP
ncbi:MAG TPA: tetratricopeptide repeat protein [Gemmatimonadales bacterium]|nr:tetratricopeptide repeat protein [Gemmatimonadales bacterium]